MTKNISIFIPAYNAAQTIGTVIDRIPDSLWDRICHVYIIDDGSIDNTGNVVNRIAAERLQCVAVHRPVNGGYGPTVKHGLELCSNDNSEYVVCLHADGQYPPESIEPFVQTMEQKDIDLLQGSRIASGTALSGGMPLYKFIAGKVLTAIENGVFGLSMTDYHSGFIVYRKRLVEIIQFDRLSDSFDFDLEMIAAARAAELSIGELPIPTRYADEKSYLNPLLYGLRVLRVVARYKSGWYEKMYRKGGG